MSTYFEGNPHDLPQRWVLRRLLTSSSTPSTLVQQIVKSTILAEVLATSTLHSYVPAFKMDMSTSILSGDLWIQQCLQHDNYRYMTETFGMNANTFALLCVELNLEDGKSVSKELQLAIFLLTVRGRLHLRLLGDRVQKAKSTASRYFKIVLSRLIDPAGFYGRQVRMPSSEVRTPTYIARDPRFSGYFDKCIGAVDKTHVPIFRKVTGADAEDPPDWRSFRDHHGNLTWNALAICDFDMRFLYVLPGFEGAAHDSRLWDFAMHKDLVLPPGRWLLGDNGFPLCDQILTPYTGVRYHLQEWFRFLERKTARQRLVRDYAELFNLRHASARNIVERSFGVLKNRFPILNTAPEYTISIQAWILPALCALHNYLRTHNDPALETVALEEEGAMTSDYTPDDTREDMRHEPQVERESTRRRYARCSRLRDDLAEKMWEEYCLDIGNEKRERIG